ncbi:MAG: hypothetical protein WC700_19005 [Gemmatimonadaceae bacterium]
MEDKHGTMTWGDFKREVEKQGITNEMEIYWIETNVYPTSVDVAVDGTDNTFTVQ